MADERFRDLLDSPLGDEPPATRERTVPRSWLPAAAIGLAAGGLLTLGGFVLADDGDPAPPPTTAAPPVTVAADPFAPGTFSVAFPAPDPPADPVAIELAGRALRAGTGHITGLALPDGLPWSGVPERPRVTLEDGLELVIDGVEVAREGGELRWHLEGPEELDAVVGARVLFFAGGIQVPNLVMEQQRPATFLGFFGTAAPPPIPAREGVVELAPPGQGRGGSPNRGEVHWVIDWLSILPAEASLSLEGVPVVTATG